MTRADRIARLAQKIADTHTPSVMIGSGDDRRNAFSKACAHAANAKRAAKRGDEAAALEQLRRTRAASRAGRIAWAQYEITHADYLAMCRASLPR